jgi:hypothetical protein
MDAPATANDVTPAAPATEPKIVVTRADIAAARARNKQQRREDLRNWTPNESTSYREMTLSFRSGASLRVFHLGLVHAQVSLYKFYEALPTHQDAVRSAEATISKKFEKLEKLLEERLTLVKATATAVMADDVSGFTSPQEVVVRMLTLEAVRFAELLLRYDELISLCHALYWAGKMSRVHRGNIVTEVRNQLLGFAREIHVLYMQAKRSVMAHRLEKERSRILKEKRKAYTAKMARDAEAAARAESVSSDTSAPVEALVHEDAPAPKPKRARKTNGAAPAEATA